MSSDAIALPAVGESGKPVRARLAAASMLGTILEWYDFSIYNTMGADLQSRVLSLRRSPDWRYLGILDVCRGIPLTAGRRHRLWATWR